ncbi:MAG: EF-hand domain-containing protein [Verrucomicrobiota bacterium]
MNIPFLSIVSGLLLVAHPTSAIEAPKLPDRPPGPPPGGEMQGPQQTAAEEIKEYLTLDRNGDGNLSKEELSERFQSLITRADSDHDGMVSSEELVQMISLRFAAKAKRGGGRGPGGPPPGAIPQPGPDAKPRPGTP